MAALGPPQPPPLRLGPWLRVSAELALRVPSLFFIDAIFNSSPLLPGDSLWVGLLGGLLRLLGERFPPHLPPSLHYLLLGGLRSRRGLVSLL